MLQDRGQLNIDDPLTRYIPDAPTAWQGITLRHLLAHTSGLGDHNPLLAGHFGEPFTPARLWGIIRTLPLDSRPGEKHQYSNAGFSILGMVIEKVSGQTYGDFLRANIFAPLHMDATGYNPPAGAKDAVGYEMGDDTPVAAAHRDLTNSFSAGGLVSTTHDLLKWQEALFAGRLISKAALAEMQAQGLGIERMTLDGHTVYSHSGHLPGYVSDAAYQPEGGLSVIVLGNLDNSSPLWISRALTTIAPRPAGRGCPSAAGDQGRAGDPGAICRNLCAVTRSQPDRQRGRRPSCGTGHGPDKVRAYAESETMFFAKTVEARLEFVRDKEGRIGCILHQAGQDVPGVRQQRD
jgi:CubicO group peptidase (beta-lactamase class C family)